MWQSAKKTEKKAYRPFFRGHVSTNITFFFLAYANYDAKDITNLPLVWWWWVYEQVWCVFLPSAEEKDGQDQILQGSQCQAAAESHVEKACINLSNAEAIFVQSKRMQRFLRTL